MNEVEDIPLRIRLAFWLAVALMLLPRLAEGCGL